MGIEKLTSTQLEQASAMLKALAHPVRITIVNYLEDGKKLNVTEIHNLLRIEQSTTSHHLGILKDKGVLVSIRDGKNTFYSLKHENLKHLVNCITACISK